MQHQMNTLVGTKLLYIGKGHILWGLFLKLKNFTRQVLQYLCVLIIIK